MKKITVWMVSLLSLSATAQQSLVVSGKIDTSLHTSAVYFYERVWPYPVLVDSFVVKKDGSFIARLPKKSADAYLVSEGENTQFSLWADGDKVRLHFNKDRVAVMEGDANFQLVNAANRLLAARMEGMNHDSRAAFHTFQTSLNALVKNNRQLPAVICLLRWYDFEADAPLIDEVLKVLQAKYPNNKAVQQYAWEARRLRKGAPAPDFSFLTTNGSKTTLQQVLRKSPYTLVDVWGTYCIPCREGIPGIKKLYEAYHAKGLNVLAVSLDDKGELWKKSLKEEAMPWAQGRVTDRGRELMKLYRFNGIPYLALFDSTGGIVQLAMSHHELEEKFRELMGAPASATTAENAYAAYEYSAEEKKLQQEALTRNLDSDYVALLQKVNEQAFSKQYLQVLKELGTLKVFQEGKISYSLPLFYQSLKNVAVVHASKADQQKSYDSLERKQFAFLRMVLEKELYLAYLHYRKNNPLLSPLLPVEPEVRTGVLPNGFTYFIRRNPVPEKQVLLYLVNKVGSILENDEERGLAHFMEHMNFNGTRHFPGNQLVEYLQKAGVRFGADLNAYTGFDETVYELPVSSGDPVLLENAFRVMRDWAQEATLDSLEIEKERGVVLEEKRLGKGAAQRANESFFPVITNHSRYAQRLPIGNDTVLKHFAPATLRNFHHNWYRPDLQALIVAGDIDVEQAEQWIKAQFSSLVQPADAPERIRYKIPLTNHNQFVKVTDAEITGTQIQIAAKRSMQPLRTESDYVVHMKKTLLGQLLRQRLFAESNTYSNPAFTNVSASVQPLMGGLEMFSVDIAAKGNQLQEAFAQGWRMIARLHKQGFTAAEFTRVKQAYVRSLENEVKEEDKTPSKNRVSELKACFLSETGVPGIAWELAFVKEHLPQISVADMNDLLAGYLNPVNQDILVQGPAADSALLPDAAVVRQWMQHISSDTFAAYKEQDAAVSLMQAPAHSATTVATRSLPALAITEMVLSNGVKVVLKPTSFRNNEIQYYGFAPGGTSVYPDSLFASAAIAANAIGSMGLSAWDPVALNQLLTGKTISSHVFIKDRTQGVAGVCAPDDLETALQLVYLQFTAPRTDQRLFNNMINGIKAGLLNRYADPVNVFNDTVNYVLGGYHYRAAPLTLALLNRVQLPVVESIYRNSFADASAFTFLFTGNFDTAAIRPLLEQYLGTLPALHKKTQAAVAANPIPSGAVTRIVYKGREDKATVKLVISGKDTIDPMKQLALKTVGEILEMRLLQSLREQEGEVYSPAVKSNTVKYPFTRYVISVSFGCAPQNTDHLVSLVQQAVKNLVNEGPTAEELQKCKAAHAKLIEQALQNNNFWMSYLSTQYENGEDVQEVLHYKEYLDHLTLPFLKQEAKRYLDTPNLVKLILLPESID